MRHRIEQATNTLDALAEQRSSLDGHRSSPLLLAGEHERLAASLNVTD